MRLPAACSGTRMCSNMRYWHACCIAYMARRIPILEWLRLPGDAVFIVFGVIPIVIALVAGYAASWRAAQPHEAAEHEPA